MTRWTIDTRRSTADLSRELFGETTTEREARYAAHAAEYDRACRQYREDALAPIGGRFLLDAPRGTRVTFEHAGATVVGTYAGLAEWTVRGRIIDRGIFVEHSGARHAYKGDEITGLRPAGDAVLPECAAFVGTAGRCSTCKTRRALHA